MAEHCHVCVSADNEQYQHYSKEPIWTWQDWKTSMNLIILSADSRVWLKITTPYQLMEKGSRNGKPALLSVLHPGPL